MSDAAKKTDALEHIKELKGYEASKLNGLSHRIRTARSGLDETAALVRERMAEVAKIVEAEKMKSEADKIKAAAEASAKKDAVETEPETEVAAEKNESEKVEAAAEKVEKVDKVEAADAAEKQGDVEKTEKTPEKPEKTPEKAAKSPKEDKAEKAEKAAKARIDIKKKVDKFFDLQESGGQTAEPSEPAESAVPENAEKDKAAAPRPVVRTENDPAKRAEAEAGMTTSYSSGGRPAAGYQGQNQGYQNRPQGQGYQGQGNYQQNRPQGQGYQGQNQGYQNRPQGQGNYQNRPQGQGYQGQNQGGYQQNRPQQGQGYQQNRPQGQGGYQNRPQGQGKGQSPYNNVGARPLGGRPAASILPQADARKEPLKKKTVFNDDKKALTKKALIQKGYVVDDITLGDDDDIVANRRYKVKKGAKKHEFIQPIAKIDSAVITDADITIKILSEKIGKSATEIIKKLWILGFTKTINEDIDFETAELIASEFGITLTLKIEKTYEEVLENFNIDEELSDAASEVRPPVVTIMGHVDHGKTSLLDYIRNTQVAEGEAGGITQHIGAYTISLNGKPITFIDTPGHEAFTAMRARGAQITDIAILVVAADDGVMPQTIEAINHAKAAGVSIIVAINKIDKPTADAARIKQQVSEHGLLPEEWGGDVPMIGVSAKSGEGVQSLLENILTLAEYKELKANPKRAARGTVVEARMDKGRGPVATILVQNGTLRIADTIVAGTTICRVRAMIDDKGKNVKEAGPSIPVSVLGFDSVPEAGDNIFVVGDEKLAKQVTGERGAKIKSQKIKAGVKMSLEDAYDKISKGLVKDLNLIVKADVQGSSEALNQALLKISNAEVRVNIIHSGVGAVNESDVMLASTSSAIVIGFNVRPDNKAKLTAERDGVDIKVYRIIYDAIEDVEKAIKGMLAPKFKEVILGQASVRQVFKVSNVGTIAGCMVTSGKIARNVQLRLLRDNVIIHEGSVASLKRFKDDAKEVATGFECGIGITDYNDLKEGDVIEAFIMEKIEI